MDYHFSKQIPCYRAGHHEVATVAFDLQEELLWTGTSGGHVSSYYGSNMDKYTAFQTGREGILQLLPYPSGLLSLTANELRSTARTGRKLATVSGLDGMTNLQSMLLLDQDTVLMGSLSGSILNLNLEKKEVCGQLYTTGKVCLLKASEHCVYSGETSGIVGLHDPRTLKRVQTLTTHSAGLSDMEVVGPYLVTCGLTTKYGQEVPDDELVVYDLRTLRRLRSNTFQSLCHPLLLRCMSSTYPSSVLVLSRFGHFQLVDLHGLVTPASMMVHHLGTEGYPTCLDISPSFECIAFGDSTGMCQLWTSGVKPTFNHYAQPTVFADNPTPPPFISWNQVISVPFSMVAPIPFPTEYVYLVSEWPPNYCRDYRRPRPIIPADILSTMRMTKFVGHAARPPWLLRNQCPYNILPFSADQLPRSNEDMMARVTDLPSPVPTIYQPVQIKYSKSGIEQVDFSRYNSTNFAGLEINIPNAYCNGMLQVLYFLEPIRCAMQSHQCPQEFCLSCELGFLFRMLDASAGNSCQASNFLRVFRALRDSAALKLLITREEEESRADLCKLIQRWTRFVLEQLNQELKQATKLGVRYNKELQPSTIERLFGTNMQTSSVCCMCRTTSIRSSTDLHFSLNYEKTGLSNDQVLFTDVLQQSICLKQSTFTWCENCMAFKSTTQNKKPLKLPNVLMLNCGLDKKLGREFWRKQSDGGKKQWVPLGIKMSILADGQLMVEPFDGSKEDEQGQACYKLISAVAHVKEASSTQPGNLVARIRVGSSYHERKENGLYTAQWYLFNDFAIHPIPESEAVMFRLDWLTPCVLVYSQGDLYPNSSGTRELEPDLLYCETHPPGCSQATCIPLSRLELPLPGDLVGLDTEFVSLSKEQAEVHSNWTSNTLKPSQLSVARITVVRGTGPSQGIPFIDDYIATSERVVDYLTRWSGINPGDLDPATSSKHITTLKASYLKLLYLIERGVKFVGHGLKNDFRVVNILVPQDQVIDTVELFHLPKQRYISLRFLAWFYLGLHIQEDTHNSIEDARTAVLLYYKFKELQQAQVISQSLRRMYETGRKSAWKLPPP